MSDVSTIRAQPRDNARIKLSPINAMKAMADLMRFRDPLRGINNLQRQMDDMFDNLMSRNWPVAVGNMPTMDIYTEGR
jgi:hypothetical protein